MFTSSTQKTLSKRCLVICKLQPERRTKQKHRKHSAKGAERPTQNTAKVLCALQVMTTFHPNTITPGPEKVMNDKKKDTGLTPSRYQLKARSKNQK